MDYSNILKELNEASLFDLFRLNTAIFQQLDNPKRIKEIKNLLRVGEHIKYFNTSTNKLVEAEIITLNRTRILVENLQDKERWNITYASVNIDDVKIDISLNQKYGIDKSELKIGEIVSFLDKENNLRYGVIERLNQKTATIRTKLNEKWRVAYSHLSKVTDIDVEIEDETKYLKGN